MLWYNNGWSITIKIQYRSLQSLDQYKFKFNYYMEESLKDKGDSTPLKPHKQQTPYSNPLGDPPCHTPLPSQNTQTTRIQTTVFKKRVNSTAGKTQRPWKGHLNHKIRVILFNWMGLVTAEKGLLRETYALATSYMDSYILANPQIKRHELQLSGFACISLAAKVEQSRAIIFSSKEQTDSLFNSAQIENQEAQILKNLGYRLNPDTYIYWLSLLITHWDHYVEKKESHYNSLRYTTTGYPSFVLCREVYQMGDLFNSVLKSTEYDKEETSLNLFYVVTKKNCLNLKRDESCKTLTSKINKKDEFMGFYKGFIETMCKTEFEINEKLTKWMCRLFGIAVNLSSPVIAIVNPEESPNDIQKYSKRYGAIQTYHPDAREFLLSNFNEQ